MRVTGLIGLLMMYAMHGNPEDRSAFEAERPANGEEIFQPQWALVTPMRMQPVVSHADPETGGDPVNENGGQEVAPTEHKQRSNRADVKQAENDYGRPVQTFAPGVSEVVFGRLGYGLYHAFAD
jgi:hypothetical protein